MGTIELVVIGAMIALNGVFAAFEIALASLGLGRLHALAEQRRRGAAAALRMKQDMEASLAVVQLGITLVGAVAAATGGAGAEESLTPLLEQAGLAPRTAQILGIALIVAPLTAATIVLGELAPKVFALRNQERVCLRLAPLMLGLSYATFPAVWLLEHSVSWIMDWGRRRAPETVDSPALQELLGAAALARLSRVIGHREQGIIASASRLATIPLGKIMLPAEFIGMLPADLAPAAAVELAHHEMHTRYPVTEHERDPQRIVGYVNFKDLVAAARQEEPPRSLRGLLRPLRVLDESLPVAECLERLMRERSHIALVRGQGRVVGLVTLEDIVEEIVGEIYDEFDRLPSHLVPFGGGWIAGGFVPLPRLHSETGVELRPLSEKPALTLNDWITERLERPPRRGDQIEVEHARVIVRKVKQVLVQEALVLPRAEEEASTRNNSDQP